MTLGEFIDAAAEAAANNGIELNGIDWSHSRTFDNFRLTGRQEGDVGRGRTAILKNANGREWTGAQVRQAVSQLVALIGVRNINTRSLPRR
jgi:hypothetical protein